MFSFHLHQRTHHKQVQAFYYKRRSFEDDIMLFRQGAQELIDTDKEIEDILLLGDSYIFMEPKGSGYDVTLEYFKLKIADRKNILCLGDSPISSSKERRLSPSSLCIGLTAESLKKFIGLTYPTSSASSLFPFRMTCMNQ